MSAPHGGLESIADSAAARPGPPVDIELPRTPRCPCETRRPAGLETSGETTRTDTWHRVVLDHPDDLQQVIALGRHLAPNGLPTPGRSIWYSSRGIGLTPRMPGDRVVTNHLPSPGVVWIYFSPGTAEILGDALDAFQVEPCDRPNRADVGLLIGERRDWEELFD